MANTVDSDADSGGATECDERGNVLYQNQKSHLTYRVSTPDDNNYEEHQPSTSNRNTHTTREESEEKVGSNELEGMDAKTVALLDKVWSGGGGKVFLGSSSEL